MKMKMRITKPLVHPTTRKEPLEDGRDQTIDDEDLAFLVPRRPPETEQRKKRKGPPVWQDPTATLEQQVVQGFARVRRRDLDFGQKVRR